MFKFLKRNRSSPPATSAEKQEETPSISASSGRQYLPELPSSERVRSVLLFEDLFNRTKLLVEEISKRKDHPIIRNVQAEFSDIAKDVFAVRSLHEKQPYFKEDYFKEEVDEVCKFALKYGFLDLKLSEVSKMELFSDLAALERVRMKLKEKCPNFTMDSDGNVRDSFRTWLWKQQRKIFHPLKYRDRKVIWQNRFQTSGAEKKHLKEWELTLFLTGFGDKLMQLSNDLFEWREFSSDFTSCGMSEKDRDLLHHAIWRFHDNCCQWTGPEVINRFVILASVFADASTNRTPEDFENDDGHYSPNADPSDEAIEPVIVHERGRSEGKRAANGIPETGRHTEILGFPSVQAVTAEVHKDGEPEIDALSISRSVSTSNLSFYSEDSKWEESKDSDTLVYCEIKHSASGSTSEDFGNEPG